MKLSRLFIYPIKSAAGLEVRSGVIDEFGLANDRRWMIVDEHGTALTQREHPQLALVHPTVTRSGLELSASGLPSLAVHVPEGPEREVVVWSSTVRAHDAGNEAAQWLTDFLERPARLVHMPDAAFRPIDRHYSPAERRVSFADAFPFLLITQESMDELNRRLQQPLGIERFRPNLVVSGAAAPHAEDSWTRIRIGTQDFSVVKPCARCAVPTVDPVTGVRGKEPTRTLATYRRRNGKVYFGQNLIHESTGELRVGDVVAIVQQ